MEEGEEKEVKIKSIPRACKLGAFLKAARLRSLMDVESLRKRATAAATADATEVL